MTVEHAIAGGFEMVNNRDGYCLWIHSSGSPMLFELNGTFKQLFPLDKTEKVVVYPCEQMALKVTMTTFASFLDSKGLLIAYKCQKCKFFVGDGQLGIEVSLRRQPSVVDQHSYLPTNKRGLGTILIWDTTLRCIVCVKCFEQGLKLNTIQVSNANTIHTTVW